MTRWQSWYWTRFQDHQIVGLDDHWPGPPIHVASDNNAVKRHNRVFWCFPEFCAWVVFLLLRKNFLYRWFIMWAKKILKALAINVWRLYLKCSAPTKYILYCWKESKLCDATKLERNVSQNSDLTLQSNYIVAMYQVWLIAYLICTWVFTCCVPWQS